MKRLKILVFDDSEVHRKSAELCLGKDHDLTIVSTYNEAQEALKPKTDYARSSEITRELEKSGMTWGDASREANERATTYPDFDVVLTDLMVPASRQALGEHGDRKSVV